MNALIVGHETRVLARTRAFGWIMLLLAAAMIVGAWSGRAELKRQQAGAQAVVAAATATRDKLRHDLGAYEQRMAAAGRPVQIAVYSHSPRGPIPQGTNAGSVGLKSPAIAVLPPTGLAAFSVGQNDLQLGYIPVTTAGIAATLTASELGNPVNLRRGTFDIAFVVIFLLPIFIIAITYDMLARENERGTLAMVLSHPVRTGTLIAGKVAARFGIILAVVLAFGLGSLLAVGSRLDAPDTWLRFGLWLGATLLYALFWFGLAAIVNACGRRSSTNGIILAGLWLLLVIVVPTLVSIVATTAYPAPSRFDFITASRTAQTSSERQYMQALSEYYYDHAEYAPEVRTNDFLTVAMAKNEAVEKAVQPLHDRFRSQLERQEQMVGSFQYLSPAIMMQRLLNGVSGTGATRYADFTRQVEAFRTEWVDYFTVRFLLDKPLASTEFPDFPRFHHVEEPFGAVLRRLASSLAGLFAVAGLAAWVAALLLRRYRVVGS